MAHPSVLIIALTANELGTARTAALLSTAHEVLGPDVSIRVEAFGPPASGFSGTLAQTGSEARRSSAYARLGWDDANPNLAHLECFIPESHRWVHRDVSFTPEDPPAESGRTLGFVIASIYLGNESPAEAPRDSGPQKPTKRQLRPAPAKHFVVHGAASLAGPGDVTSMGALLGVQAAPTRSLALGLAGDLRFGTVGSAQSSVRFIGIGVLLNYRFWPTRGPVWLGPQLLAGAEQVRFSHFSEDDPKPVGQSAWAPRADGLLAFNWELSETSLATFALGTNYRFGQVDAYVRDIRRAHIPAWVGVARLGIGARF